MARRKTLRLTCLAVSNLLIPVAVLVFATGFFPYKPVLPGLATFEDVQESSAQKPEAVFDRVVFMVVDALRSDFVYGYDSGFEFTQSLIRSGSAIPFTAHATPPTVTMPRVKALTTGSVPSFLDLILNFAESDTTSSLAGQDTWLAQINAGGGSLVFYGDDTWLKLFPGEAFFARADGTSSFFVSDFTEVDFNVTRHVPHELEKSDWNAMILHYLGLDHIGHKTGPQGPNMLPKQREMDGIVRVIYEAISKGGHMEKTLLVVAGDHGMNAGGNHGGSGPGETEPALLFVSPIFASMAGKSQYECPTTPKEGTEFHYYTKIQQSDLVPALAALMALPVPKNSLGVLVPELAAIWTGDHATRHLERNARQMLNIVRAKYGDENFDTKASSYGSMLATNKDVCRSVKGDEDQLACEWAQIQHNIADESSDPRETQSDLYTFLNHAQEAMSDTASSYDIPRMISGMAITAAALLAAVLSFPSFWPPSLASFFFATICILYGVMMFASSYVEEEQHFWYWLSPAWIAVLVVESLWKKNTPQASRNLALAGVVLLLTHRFAVRWNQTGQKHAGEPDIVHTIFPEHHVFMWLLILATYIMSGIFIHLRTFAGILPIELATLIETSLIVLGIIFKLNFTQADAPELVRGLAERIRDYSTDITLVTQARAVFVMLAVAVAIVLLSAGFARLWSKTPKEEDEDSIALSERLHHLLTVFLITQTRAPNIPLFLLLELQRQGLSRLLSRQEDGQAAVSSVIEVATSTLLFSHVAYFCFGGSNSISSIDLSNAYNGVADYNFAAVGVLLFASNWAGAIWWCSAAVQLLLPRTPQTTSKVVPVQDGDRDWVLVERSKLHDDAKASLLLRDKTFSHPSSVRSELWTGYISSMTAFVATGLLAVMAACTALRTHLFIWTVFSPKFLYAMAWAVGWHLLVNVGFGSLLHWLR